MRRFVKLAGAVALVLPLLVLPVGPSAANVLSPHQTVFNTDFASFGYGGIRGIGTGAITVAGVSGTVTRALLYWQGPTNSSSASANAAVSFGGSPVTGTQIGFSNDNCWGFLNSQAYRADVTGLVPGNGSYALGGFLKTDADINGVSLLVFFDDGNPANNRDVVLFDGNDSNINNAFDPPGWNANLAGINYAAGAARLQLHVGDGQSFTDDGVIVNGTVVAPAGGVFNGDTVPNGASAASTAGGLWDIRTFDVTALLTPGPNALTLTSGVAGDCLGLVVAAFDLPAGAAPSTSRVSLAVCSDPSVSPLTPLPGYNVIVGSPGHDAGATKLVGTPGNDLIFGLGGHDEIDGAGGDDVILAGDGNDQVAGGDGNDILCGGAGNDALDGNAGEDGLDGGPGNDSLQGGDGNDVLRGGAGFDNLDGGPGVNTNDGGPDADRCANGVNTNCSP